VLDTARLRAACADADRWLRTRPAISWLLLSLVTGSVYATGHALIRGDLPRGLALGVAFGVTFATVTHLVQRRSRS
jgi:hypothetical protein